MTALLAAVLVASAPVARPALAAPAHGSHGSLPFVADDYPAALARAKAQHKPLFIDFWATWCHSCLSMQRFVLSDPGMKPVAKQVIWLSIETETERNKAVVDKFPLDGWPTFLVIDPGSEKVLGRWLGSGSVQELRGFVQDATLAYQGQSGDPAAVAQRAGDEARIQGDLAASAAAYGEAVGASKQKDARRPERMTLYVSALRKLKTPEALRTCVQLGLKEIDATPDTAVAADFASYVDDCGAALPKGDPDAAQVRERATARITALLAKPSAQLAADDRSDALATLSGMLEEAGKHDESKARMQERAQVLEAAAQAAPDVALASTFDAHRTDTYLALGQPEKAEKMLAAREIEVPSDYNPPARLARVYLEEGRLPDAEAAVDRALKLMTRGQRRVGVLGLKAKILTAEGKPVREVLQEQLEVLRGLPQSQRNPASESKIEAQLATKTAATK